MGPVVTRLFNARPYKQKTVTEEAEPAMHDEMIFPPPSLKDEEGMLKLPNRLMDLRKRSPNPRRGT